MLMFVSDEQLKLLFNLMMNDPKIERVQESVELSSKGNASKFEN